LLTNDGVEGTSVDTLADARRVAETMHKHLQSMTTAFGLDEKTQPMAMPATVPAAFKAQFDKVVQDYLRLAKALAGDGTDEAKAAADQGLADLKAVDMKLLQGDARTKWMKDAGVLETQLSAVSEAQDIEKMRQAFALLSEQTIAAVKQFGWTGDTALYQLHCPMAFDNRGADWLQDSDQTHNPYFGATMPTCGSVVEVIATGQ
jgi:membrane fusion protein, copper/silver efflux system